MIKRDARVGEIRVEYATALTNFISGASNFLFSSPALAILFAAIDAIAASAY